MTNTPWHPQLAGSSLLCHRGSVLVHQSLMLIKFEVSKNHNVPNLANLANAPTELYFWIGALVSVSETMPLKWPPV